MEEDPEAVQEKVRLRPLRPSDIAALEEDAATLDDIDVFTFAASNAVSRRYASDGGLGVEQGALAVDVDGECVGLVSWIAVQHGPTPACRAWNIGIRLLPDHRRKGYGGPAQRQLVDYLFATTTAERVEAGTDVDNRAEQRALERAGFTREGVLRSAQFRAGGWRDVVLFSRLRSDA